RRIREPGAVRQRAGIHLPSKQSLRRLAELSCVARLDGEKQTASENDKPRRRGTPGEHMKILVLYAHPERNSFCGAVLDQFLAGAKQGGGDVRLRDLYQPPFNPCLGGEEFARERKGGDARS